MSTIQSFLNLERLDISKTAVTTVSLAPLQTLPLEVLNATDTTISEAGVRPLQQQFPKRDRFRIMEFGDSSSLRSFRARGRSPKS